MKMKIFSFVSTVSTNINFIPEDSPLSKFIEISSINDTISLDNIKKGFNCVKQT